MQPHQNGQNQSDKKQLPAAPTSSFSAPKQPPLSMSTAQKSPVARYAGFIAGGIVLGVIIAWGAGAWRSSPEVSSTSTVDGVNTTADANNVATTTVGSGASFSIVSPQPAGTEIAVAKAVVSEPTWVVIYEDNAGKPGNALGAALFFPDHPQGQVELLRATAAGRSYLAVEQTDNGDRKFSLKDDHYVSEDGQVTWLTFSVN